MLRVDHELPRGARGHERTGDTRGRRVLRLGRAVHVARLEADVDRRGAAIRRIEVELPRREGPLSGPMGDGLVAPRQPTEATAPGTGESDGGIMSRPAPRLAPARA